MPLTEEEAAMLFQMSVEDRHAWLKNKLPTRERLARHLAAEGAPGLAYFARLGLYDDFHENGHPTPQIKLLEDLKRAGRPDLKWIVTSGEYDGTKAESDEWWRLKGPDLVREMAGKKD